jgi:hypothetical protein
MNGDLIRVGKVDRIRPRIVDTTDSSTSLSFEVAAFNASIIVGLVLLGALVDTCLFEFGCLVVQTYVCHANVANDLYRSMVSETYQYALFNMVIECSAVSCVSQAVAFST